VIERGGDLGLAEEQIAELGARGEEHDLLLEAPGAQLLAQVDGAHAAFSKISLDAILPGRDLGGHPDSLASLFLRRNAMSFPLQTLLDLRRRTEEEAERSLAAARARQAQSEAEHQRLEECAAAAWARANTARGQVGPATAGEALVAERFQDRLADEARAADQAVLTHRKGALAAARTDEAAARAHHAAARRERLAAEQASEREAAGQRRVADRRAEDAASDLAAGRRRG
jgi:hypothetical protein